MTQDFINAAQENNVKELKKLIPQVNIDYRDSKGMSAIDWAALQGNFEAFQLLLSKGAAQFEPNPAINLFQRNILHWAVRGKNKDIVHLIL